MNIYMHTEQTESILAWICDGFEVSGTRGPNLNLTLSQLYATFGPLTTKTDAIRACNALLQWIKDEESRLFLLSVPVVSN